MENNTKFIDTAKLVLQFLIIPVLYLLWNMAGDVTGLKERLVRVETTISAHQASTKASDTMIAEVVRLQVQISNLEREVERNTKRLEKLK